MTTSGYLTDSKINRVIACADGPSERRGAGYRFGIRDFTLRYLLLSVWVIFAVSSTASASGICYGREEVSGHYEIRWSKDDQVCDYVLATLNEDLEANGFHCEALFNPFGTIDWKPFSGRREVPGDKLRSWNTRGNYAEFDIDNDGTVELVFNIPYQKSDFETNSLFILDDYTQPASYFNGAFTEAPAKIYYAGLHLSLEPENPDWVHSRNKLFFGIMSRPFIHDKTSYLLFHDHQPGFTREHEGYVRHKRFALVMKYFGGNMGAWYQGRGPSRAAKKSYEHICHLERVDVVRAPEADPFTWNE